MAADEDTDARELEAEVTPWLREHWDPELPAEESWRLVGQAGWSAPHLAVEQGGRGLPRSAGWHARSLFEPCGALRPPGALGLLPPPRSLRREPIN